MISRGISTSFTVTPSSACRARQSRFKNASAGGPLQNTAARAKGEAPAEPRRARFRRSVPLPVAPLASSL